jgi:hypothetical protein
MVRNKTKTLLLMKMLTSWDKSQQKTHQKTTLSAPRLCKNICFVTTEALRHVSMWNNKRSSDRHDIAIRNNWQIRGLSTSLKKSIHIIWRSSIICLDHFRLPINAWMQTWWKRDKSQLKECNGQSLSTFEKCCHYDFPILLYTYPSFYKR